MKRAKKHRQRAKPQPRWRARRCSARAARTAGAPQRRTPARQGEASCVTLAVIDDE
ncbi:MAG: hypothetical protein MZW92_32945 [Comamonadaceae bacterium]|nr:hypothetical protein [Comamonadaceae bacterium]